LITILHYHGLVKIDWWTQASGLFLLDVSVYSGDEVVLENPDLDISGGRLAEYMC